MFYTISAIIAPGSMENSDPFVVDGIKIKFLPHIAIAETESPISSVEEVNEFLEKIERICVALFMVDTTPRVIDGFLYEPVQSEPKEVKRPNDPFQLRLALILGNTVDTKKYTDPRLSDMQSLMGRNSWIFNVGKGFNYVIDKEVCIFWYNYFCINKIIERKISIIMRGFGEIFLLHSSIGYVNYQKISSAILLLVPGLEGLFTSGSESNNDITFKFTNVGAIFYSKFADNEFLKSTGANKLSHEEIKKILKALYNLRSDVAHGTYQKIAQSKSWQPLYQILNIGGTDTTDTTTQIRNMLFALGLFEKHIVALLRGSKENLNMGIRIIDSVVAENQQYSRMV